MFYGALPVMFERARNLRENSTVHERLLWEELKGNKLEGLRFKRQHPIGQFIADFYCQRLKLVIEIDGAYHFTSEQAAVDKARTVEMNEHGIKVIRFTNSEVEKDISGVIERIREVCLKMM